MDIKNFEELPQEMQDKINRIINYFVRKYGFERATIIATKIAPSIKTMSEDDMIKVGEKWHWANLLFNEKCTNEEFRKALTEMGYE